MKSLMNKYLMTKLMFGIVALSGLVVFASNNQTVSRALNIARPDVKVQISGSVQRDDKVVSLDKAESVKAARSLIGTSVPSMKAWATRKITASLDRSRKAQLSSEQRRATRRRRSHTASTAEKRFRSCR